MSTIDKQTVITDRIRNIICDLNELVDLIAELPPSVAKHSTAKMLCDTLDSAALSLGRGQAARDAVTLSCDVAPSRQILASRQIRVGVLVEHRGRVLHTYNSANACVLPHKNAPLDSDLYEQANTVARTELGLAIDTSRITGVVASKGYRYVIYQADPDAPPPAIKLTGGRMYRSCWAEFCEMPKNSGENWRAVMKRLRLLDNGLIEVLDVE